MAKFVGTPVSVIDLLNAGDVAVQTRVINDTQARVRIDAGGKLTWGSGSAAGDTTLYRSDADTLATDDVFAALAGLVTLTTVGTPTEALPNGAIAVDAANDVFYFRSNGTWNEVSGGRASVADTAPVDPTVGDLWFESDTLDLFIYYTSAWLQLTGLDDGVVDIGDLADVVITNALANQVLTYDGTEWVNISGGASVSVTAPTSPLEGGLWFQSDTLDLFIYFSSAWLQLTGLDDGVVDIGDLADVVITNALANQVLTFNGTDWINAASGGITTGTYNTATGYLALSSNTTGASNTALGAETLKAVTTVSNLTAVGAFALTANTSGTDNVAVGKDALRACTTGSNHTAIGFNALTALTGGANNTGVGNGATATTTTVSNEITLGNSSIATLRCQVTSITALSDQRDKTNIKESVYGLELVNILKPVTFEWNMRDGAKVGVPDIGFIAQDLMAVEDAINAHETLALTYRSNPERLEASPGRLIPVLVKAIQEMSAEMKQLSAKVAALESKQT